MSSNVNGYSGFEDLSKMLEKYMDKVENVVEVLEVGAKALVNDALKLPKPMSRIRKSGYTHLVHSFAYRKKEKEIEAGWGKYYGPMLENGTKKMNPHPHLNPLWERHKEKYYKLMISKLKM
ncbi:MAG: hypothetical protein IKF38_04775 [Clostridia bacterium]|nr:hypothetical protein [Clostridia bacterium]